MPLEPVDLASLDAYALKSKKDVMLITNDEKPFWMYKDFPIQDKGKAVKTVLVVLVNRSKITSLLKGTLAASGTVSLKEGKISFTPEKGKVPYGLLKKMEARLFGSKKILIPTGADVEEGEGEDEDETMAQGVGVGSGPGSTTPQPGTTPKPVVQPPPPSIPGMSPARVKFMQDFEAAKPLLAQARAIVPDSLSGLLKAVLLQLPKTSAQMNDAAGKGEWATAAEALKMLVEGATDVIEGKKKQDDAKGAAQKDFALLKPQLEQVRDQPEAGLSAALKAQRSDLIAYPGRISAAAASLDWAGIQKLIAEATPKLKKFTADKSALDQAKRTYEGNYAAAKAELQAALALKPASLNQLLQQQQTAMSRALQAIGIATGANDWSAADGQLTTLVAELKKFTAAKLVHDGKLAVEAAFAKLKPQVDDALAIPQAELAAALKPQQGVVSAARDGVNAAIGESDWTKAQGAINTLKTELKKLTDGKRDQDLARRKYADGYAKIKANVDAVEQGPKTPPLDGLKKTCLDAHTAMLNQATALEFAAAFGALADVGGKADAYLKAAGDAEAARSKAVGDTKQAALAETQEDIEAASSMPADTLATDAVRNAAASSELLTTSKGLQEILAAATNIDKALKPAILSGAAGRMAGIVDQIDTCLERIARYQADHPEDGGDSHQPKFDTSEALRKNLEAMKKGLEGLAPAMKFVASVENSGPEGAQKAAAVIVKLQRSAKMPEVKTMLKERYDEIAKRLIRPGDDEDRQREVARMLGGDKEKELFEARYNPVVPTLQAADKITTVTKATEEAKATYDKLRSIVDSAAARGEYTVAVSQLPKLKQAASALLNLQNQAKAEAAERNDRRAKATQAMKKAASPAEIEEIAKSMGGEVEAAFKRQQEKGPMKQQADAAKDLGDSQDAAKLVDGAVARNMEVARNIADRLINDEGELDAVGLFMNDPDKLAAALGVAPNSKQVVRALKKLRDEPQLAEKLASVGKPNAKNPACRMIRSSLGLKPGEEVTEVHARKAALSAMLAELRQSDVGSCYATSTAIRVHDGDPGRMLDDMKELIETGKLTRNIQKDGKTVTIEVPISVGVSSAALEKKAIVAADGTLAQVDGEDVDPPQHISGTPPVAAALSALGIAADKQQETVDTALGALRASKSQAGKTALAALPTSVPDPSDPSKEIPNKVREDLLAKIPAILAEQPDKPKAKAALQAELAKLDPTDPNFAKSADVLAAFDDYFAAADHEFTPEEILKQTALTKSGLTEADLAARGRLEAMNLKLRAVRGDDPEDPATVKLLDEYNDLATKVSSKREFFGKYDEMVGAAKDSYAAQDNNRLLCAWEYSVSTLAEKGVAQVHAPVMKKAAEDQVKKALDKSVLEFGEGVPTPKLAKVAADLQKKYSELWDQNVTMGYDAAKQGALSADGSSSKGAFCLFDKAGIDDPNQHIPVNDKQSYTKLIEGLIAKAASEILDGEYDSKVVEYVKKVAGAVADQAAKDAEGLVTEAVDDLHARGKKKYKEPWAVVAGNNMTPILSTYYAQDVSASVEELEPADPDEMTGFLLDSGRQLLANVPDKTKLTPDTRIPMRGGPHVWSFRPGDPKVRKVLESPGDANAFKNEERAKYDSQKNTPLSPELKKMLLDKTFDGWPDKEKEDLLNELAAMPSPKAGDVVKKVHDYFANHPEVDNHEFAEEAEFRALNAVMQSVLPPVPRGGGKLEAHLDGVLKELDLGENEAKVKASVVAQLNVPPPPPPKGVPVPPPTAPAPFSMTDIEKAVARVLKAHNLRPDEAAAAAEVCQAQKPEPTPPGLPFGDTNWGGGDHHTLFTMVRNPKTDSLEMWQCNEDGSDPMKLDSDEWINGQPYEMATNPALIGGLV